MVEGHLTFDTKANEVFPWWTKEDSDQRSMITLRHLLSFTSGFYWEDPSGFVPLACARVHEMVIVQMCWQQCRMLRYWCC